MELYKVSEVSIATMPIRDVVAEYRKIQAEMNRPDDKKAGWHGWNDSMMARMEGRLNQLKTRLADSYVSQFPEEKGETENVES